MWVFVFLFILLFITHFYTSKNRNITKGRRQETMLGFLYLWLLQGLRHRDVGIDSRDAYIPFFEMLNPSFLDHETIFGFEYGFFLFSKFIKAFISSEPQVFILICSFLFIFPIAILFYKHSKNISFSYLAFSTIILYHFGFSGLRQACAIGITVLSFEFVVNKKIIPFILLVLLASTFHASAILFIVTYPIYHYVKISKNNIILFLLGTVGILIFLRPLAEVALDTLFIANRYSNKFNHAFETPSYNMIIVYLGFFFMTFVGKKADSLIPYRGLLLMTVILQSMALINGQAPRMALYFIPYLCVALPFAIDGYSKKNSKIVYTSLSIFLVFFFFYTNASGYLDVIPYKFFWE